ncbi:MAG: hypothetical protein IPJ65_25345 [Archangiaceae bacterium]|nr:hypothetical protein [Archangiaceae bacterium]
MHRFSWLSCLALLVCLPALAHTEPTHFGGALRSDGPVRLQRAAVFFQAGEPGFDVPVESMNRVQLQAEYDRLDRERPGLGGPIALSAVGGGLVLVSFLFALEGLAAFGYYDAAAMGYALLGLATVAVIVGAVLLTVGLVKLFTRLGPRKEYGQRMDDVRARIDTLDQGGAQQPPPPPPPDDLPPPAPPPPGAQRFDLPPGYLVATF